MRKLLCLFIILGIIPLFGLSAFGGGGFVAAKSPGVLTTDSGFIIQSINEDENSVFMQHILINDSGTPVDVSVSSYASANFLKIDETCKSLTLFTNHVLVIPYSPVQISDLGRYVMLPALVEFEHPETFVQLEIFFEKYSLLLDDGENTGFTNSIDFSCDDVYTSMNPKYDNLFQENLTMQSQPDTSSQNGGQQGSQQNGGQSGTNLTPQEQELLQQADELLREYQMVSELQNSPLNPTERPFLVEQNTEQFREEIAQQIQLQEELMQELQQNSNFQNLDERLSKDGLIQQPPSFDISDEETTVSIPYENDETSATISAEFENGEITNVFIERPTDEIETSLLWVLPLVIGIIVIVVLLSKRLPKTKPITKIPIVLKNDSYTISYADLTREMLREAKHMYNEELFKDAHEKLSQTIRFYYSNRFSTGSEITNMDALQLLRKEDIPEFDSVLNYLGMCEMIEFAKNPTEKKRFFSAIENFSQFIE